ncbi:MAG: hypothetical protein WD049_04845 [Candidatus Paceibacterota bacterium]
MNRYYLLPFFIFAFGVSATGVFAQTDGESADAEPRACTQEAMLCPDGSYVGRTGPNCEFAACPGDGSDAVSIQKASVEVGEEFVFDASARSSDDGSIQSFSWTQVSGPFTFDAQEGTVLSVTPPSAGVYVFELSAMDMDSNTSVVETIEICVGLTGKCDDTDTDADGHVDVRQGAQPRIIDNKKDLRKTDVDSNDDDSGVDDETGRGNNPNMPPGHQIAPSQVKVLILAPVAPGGDPIAAKAVELRGWDLDKKEAFLGEVKSHAQLQSGEDLENFARGVLLENEDVEEIEFTDEGLEVRSRTPARLFGVFSASLTVTTRVTREGDVEASLPWYSFLFSKSMDTDEVEEALAQELAGVAEESERADTELRNEFQVAARALEGAISVIATKRDTSE